MEAVLFASAEPVEEAALAARLGEGADLRGLLAELQSHYSHRGVHLVAAS
ncbi:SMC-Scp complex subunit ScpB, partial [Azospirillum sp. B4]